MGVTVILIVAAEMIGSSSQFHADWGNMAAVAILATIPVFIITFLFQRQIVEGITVWTMTRRRVCANTEIRFTRYDVRREAERGTGDTTRQH